MILCYVHWDRLLAVTAILIAFQTATAAHADQSTTTQNGDFPIIPTPRLTPINKSIDVSAHRKSITVDIEQVVTKAREASDPEHRAAALIEAANRTLSYELEPMACDRFLGLDRPDAAESLAAARAGLDRVRSLCAEVAGLLEQLPADDSSTVRQETQKSLAKIDAFAAAMQLFLNTNGSTDGASDARHVISKLAPLLESDDMAVAGAASFWRACIWALEPDPHEALSRLELVTADMPPESLRFGFFKRLLRCRLVAKGKSEPNALALLVQIEERIDDWFRNEPDRLDAMRAVGLFQLQTLRAWYERLDAVTESDERSWCIREAKRIVDERFADGEDTTILRLVEAVPFPRPQGPPPTDAPEPADKPDKPEEPQDPALPPPE